MRRAGRIGGGGEEVVRGGNLVKRHWKNYAEKYFH